MEKPLASNRQLKLLKFFGEKQDVNVTSDLAHRIISRNFLQKPYYRELWAKYKYLTGDEDYETSDLRPFDLEKLIDLELPEDWQKSGSGKNKGKIYDLVVDELKQGIPFEDPEPEIDFKSNDFVLSGIFLFGKKKKCYEEIIKKGGSISKNVTRNTRYLIIGGNPNPNWSNEGYGNKIEKAFYLKLSGAMISILSEAHWRNSL